MLGDESLETISLLGYVAATMLLYLFLRRRFSPFVSIMVTLAALLVPSLRLAAADGTTDTWGLAGLLGALLCAALALERGARWVWPWAALVLLVSLPATSPSFSCWRRRPWCCSSAAGARSCC